MGPQIDSVRYERPLSGRDNPYGLPILIMRWYFLLAAVAIFGFKQLLEARENAAVLGPVGIPGRWLALCGSGGSSLHLPPATGSTARGGASGQSQPQPYGINFIGSLVDILGIEAAARLELWPTLLSRRVPLGTPVPVSAFDCVINQDQQNHWRRHIRLERG